MKRTLLTVLVSSVMAAAFSTPAMAATVKYGGLSVSPAITQLTLAKGQDTLSFDVTVSNDSASAVSVTTRVDDFTSLDTTGSAQFLNNTSKKATAHGLAHWMMPGLLQFNLPAHGTQKVPVQITQASTMGPGGHYGAVIFGIAPPPASGQSNYIGSNTEVSVLVFLTTDNAGKHAIRLDNPSLDPASLALPDSVNLVFTNIGDTQITPRGYVVVADSMGHEIARGIINADSGQVLPATSRLYQVPLRPNGRWFWPGAYRLSVYYRPDRQSVYAHHDQQFLYIPGPLLAFLTAAFCVSLALLLRRFGPGRFYLAKR